jgi:uncharacterized membrane protein
MGQTSPIMFPIYGSAAFFKPVFRLLRHFNLLARGTIYAISIFGAEYTSGHILSKHNICPWNYSNSRFHVNGLIRLDYFPYWFGAGLLFERILVSSIAQEDTAHKVPHDRKYSASCL